jgi:zinc protease
LEPASQAGVATLVGRLLDEGTDRHSGPAIAEMIENVGGALSMNASGGTVRVLTPDRALGLGLLFECLSRANFPPEALAREQQRQLSEIDDTWSQPDTRAQLVFRELVYGKHPYGRPLLGTRPTVAALTRDECVKFHRRLFVPNNTLVALVGDFDSQDVINEVKRLTADWKSESVAQPAPPVPARPPEFTQKILSMPESAQLHFYLGHLGVPRSNPDYYKLLVMDYVLGTGPGFTDRLSAQLRDREGLAYTVSANISNSANEQPGVFTCYIGTNPDNFGKVKQRFLHELNRIRDEKPSTEEVEDAKKYLIGNLPFHVATSGQIAGQLLLIERYHLGFDYLEKYRQAVAAVTPEDVQMAARKYVDPAHMYLVASGAIDAEGRPLQRLPAPRGK